MSPSSRRFLVKFYRGESFKTDEIISLVVNLAGIDTGIVAEVLSLLRTKEISVNEAEKMFEGARKDAEKYVGS
jgi:hypothetical protein